MSEYDHFLDKEVEREVPVPLNLQQELAEWAGIDLDQLEREKQHMLDQLGA